MPVGDSELGNGVGQVVAHRARGQVETGSDPGDGIAAVSQPHHVELAGGQRAVEAEGGHGQVGIDVASTNVDAFDHPGRLVGTGVLGNEAAHHSGTGQPLPKGRSAGRHRPGVRHEARESDACTGPRPHR